MNRKFICKKCNNLFELKNICPCDPLPSRCEKCGGHLQEKIKKQRVIIFDDLLDKTDPNNFK